jgi:serine/threonine protein kinase
MNSFVTSHADVWALGCVCYELLTGITPFDGSTEKIVYSNILLNEPKFEGPVANINNINRSGSLDNPLVVDFIKCCLEKKQENRQGAADLLKHKWI